MGEENKKKETVKTNTSPQGRQLSYEQVMQVAAQTRQEYQKLYKTAQEMQKRLDAYATSDFYTRLDWLWKIITETTSRGIFGAKFYDECVQNFIEMMTPVKESADSDSKKEG